MEPLIEITLGDLLSRTASQFPDVLAIKHRDHDYTRTWREFNEEAEKIAKGFLAVGIGKGDHVSIWATNVPEWLLTLYACAKIGAVLVTVNTNYKVFELEYLLKQSDSKAIVMIGGTKNSDYVSIIKQICPELESCPPNQLKCKKLPFLKSVIYVGNQAETPAGMMNFEELRSRSEKIDNEILIELGKSIGIHDVVNMQYTSGTTGFPKGVMLTHHNIVNNGKSIGDCMKFTENDKLCVCVPLFHCFGLVLANMAAVTHGTSMVLVDSYRPVSVMAAISEEKCTAVHGVPTMFIAMLEHPDFAKYDFSRMRTGIMAGSPCPVEIMKQAVEKMNVREITIVYGLTETSPGCTQTTTEDSLEHRVGTVGRSLPHIENKIVDPETGETLGVNQPGEFCSRGYNVMKCYYKMPEATAQAIDKDGWLHSGDIATVDEEGYYRITGRIKDMIIRGGENIYPKELEEFLYTNPKVKDVQVIGVPSVAYGEEVMACIILKNGEEWSADEVKEFVRANMARHKVPSYVEFVESFPMTASGKIQKYKMREWAVEKLGLEQAENIETA